MTKACFLCGIKQCPKSEVSFHVLPTRPDIQKTWLNSLEWTIPLEVEKKYFICSRHFSNDSFLAGVGLCRKRLKPLAIPNIIKSPARSLSSTLTASEVYSENDPAIMRYRTPISSPATPVSSLLTTLTESVSSARYSNLNWQLSSTYCNTSEKTVAPPKKS